MNVMIERVLLVLNDDAVVMYCHRQLARVSLVIYRCFNAAGLGLSRRPLLKVVKFDTKRRLDILKLDANVISVVRIKE